VQERVVLSPAGTPLVCRVYGELGPVLCGCNGIGVSTVFFEPLAEQLSDAYRTVLWDYPGHGRSADPREPEQVTIVSLAADLGRVLDHAGVEQAVVMGHSLGTQVAFEFYRAFPARALGLIPTLGTSGRAVSTFFNLHGLAVPFAQLAARILPFGHRLLPPLLEPLAERRIGGRAVLDHAARLLGVIARDAPELHDYFAHLARVDLRVYAQLLREAQRHDATDMLASIAVPTLVVGASRDVFIPLRVVEQLAANIPRAELFVLEGGTHAGLFEQVDTYAAKVREFLAQRVFTESA
jgi:3-oxoadipate enol-lactonase